MSAKELDRLEVLGRVAERRLTQRQAVEQLGLSERQVRRLCRALGHHGAAGLVSRKRGRPSNRKLPAAVREKAVALVRERYADFGPTLAGEKLAAQHGVAVSTETLRQWMIGADLWVPRAQRPRRAHQPRHRRSCLGELVQIDGCEHAWFEDRGPQCTLLTYVDDATSRLMELRFAASESAFDYFASTRAYLERDGKPVAFYSDKASIFRVSAPEARSTAGITQFSRALSELNIDIPLRQHAAGQRPGGAGPSHAPRSAGQGASLARDLDARGRQRVSAAVPGRVQRALRSSAQEPA
jgi:hypothetical protein